MEVESVVKHTIPADIPLKLPEHSSLPQKDIHFLLYIPWDEQYLQFIPQEYKTFYINILNYLSARTTDVHTAVCMGYLDECIEQAESQGHSVNRNVLAYALMLHDSGWSQLSEEEIAASLGVTGLALSDTAMGPKEKHAILGEQIARDILKRKQEQLKLRDEEIDTICRAILYHDKPAEVAGSEHEMPIEVQLLVDLDHLWSFTYLNFWQDTVRKGVAPAEYIKNLEKDLDYYFVTEIGKSKARTLLAQRSEEVKALQP